MQVFECSRGFQVVSTSYAVPVPYEFYASTMISIIIAHSQPFEAVDNGRLLYLIVALPRARFRYVLTGDSRNQGNLETQERFEVCSLKEQEMGRC